MTISPGRKPPTYLLYLSLSLVAPSAFAQQVVPFTPNKVLLPISKVKVGVPLKVELGTGFCLDTDCGLIGTNYHVALLTSLPLRIRGEKVISRFLASGATDPDAVWNLWADPSTGRPARYAPVRDLAIFRLEHPLAKKGLHGIGFDLDRLQPGQPVDIYAYPTESRLVGVSRKLIDFPAAFVGESVDGQLAFKFGKSGGGKTIKPGASGGLVVDRKTQRIVGILRGLALNVDDVAMAIPVWSLADFLKSTDSKTYAELFPGEIYRPGDSEKAIDRAGDVAADWRSPQGAVPDGYWEYDFDPRPASPARNQNGNIQFRQEESAEIQLLRHKAEALSDDLKNFVAVQTLSSGGGISPFASTREISVVDGQLTFRKYPDGERTGPPHPPHGYSLLGAWIGAGSEWSDLPTRVGTNLELKIERVEDRKIGGHTIRVFHYYAALEDHVCENGETTDFLIFWRTRSVPVACSGEVWTDEDTNILRISETLPHPTWTSAWSDLRAVVLYGWLKQPGEDSKVAPVSIFMTIAYEGSLYWCEGQFMNYRVFGVKTKLDAATSDRAR
jgi:hypothetical protein